MNTPLFFRLNPRWRVVALLMAALLLGAIVNAMQTEWGTIVRIKYPTSTTCQMLLAPNDTDQRHWTPILPNRATCDRFYVGETYVKPPAGDYQPGRP
jgi:hypothetical protein